MNARLLILLCAALAAGVIATMTVVIGTTTHESHMRELDVLAECVHTDRTAAECRVILKGTP